MFKSSEKTALQEIGPRFTLKLRYIKKGIPAVRQLSAAPPPLAFDIEDADEEGTAPADTADPAYSADQVSHECDPSAASPPRKSVAPAKDEEYIWQWKVCCCFLLINSALLMLICLPSRNWRHQEKPFSYS